jgi:hypothetical protein
MSDPFGIFSNTGSAMIIGAALGSQRDTGRRGPTVDLDLERRQSEASERSIEMLSTWEEFATKLNDNLIKTKRELAQRNDELHASEQKRLADQESMLAVSERVTRLMRATKVQSANVSALQSVIERLTEILQTQGRGSDGALDAQEIKRLFDAEFDAFMKGSAVLASEEEVNVVSNNEDGRRKINAMEKTELALPAAKPKAP